MRFLHAHCCRAGACTALLMLLFWLTGCGPGVGGSGTGEETQSLTTFDAKPAPVCGTALAASLQCGVSTSSPTAIADGTATTTFVDRATGGLVTTTLQGDTVALEARCQRLHFSGVWGVNPVGQARFYGYAVNDATGARVPAQLDMTAVAGGVRVMLLDGDGRELLGLLEMVPPTAPGGSLPACS